METILIVEDDKELLNLFSTVLKKEGYQVLTAHDGVEAMDILKTEYVDLIISDIMMPRMDGYEMTKNIRERQLSTPVLMITAKDSFEDMRRGFSSGSDDYMVKPINVNELLLRVNALLRRSRMVSERKQVFGPLTLEYDTMTVIWNNESQILPQKEFMLLFKFISSPGKTFTRQQLMDEIWGTDSASDLRTVDVHINRLRDRFRDLKEYEITTIRGLGYKMVMNK